MTLDDLLTALKPSVLNKQDRNAMYPYLGMVPGPVGLLSQTGQNVEEQGLMKGLLASAATMGTPALVSGLLGKAAGGVTRTIFAGEKAKTADKKALARAKELDAAGTDNLEIWNRTGWFKSPDGKWRWEIDDSQARLKRMPLESIRTNIDDYPPRYTTGHATNRPLGDVLSHPKLYESYPNSERHGFADVEFGKGLSERGKYRSFESIKSTPTVPNISVSAGSPKKARSVLLHEIQHGVQEGEGFARGGTPETASIPMLDEINKRLSWTADEMDAMKKALLSSDKEVARRAKEQIVLLRDHYNKLMDERSNINDYDVYRRLAGEAEARAVQSRMDMTPAERRAKFPLDSYDVPLDQLIVRGLLSP